MICLLVGISTWVNAQSYETGIGFCAGTNNGFTVKHFFTDNIAIEGMLTYNGTGIYGTGLYEYQVPFRDIQNLDWFIGGGGHAGSYYSSVVLGVDGIGGLEYTFGNAPVSVSLDLNPNVNFFGNPGFFMGIGLSLRYNFK